MRVMATVGCDVRPAPIILSDGAVMAPVADQAVKGGWRMDRIAPDDSEYGYWLSEAQYLNLPSRAVSHGIWRFVLQWLLILVVGGALIAFLVYAVTVD